jgi:hypothetical protein
MKRRRLRRKMRVLIAFDGAWVSVFDGGTAGWRMRTARWDGDDVRRQQGCFVAGNCRGVGDEIVAVRSATL